MSNVTSPLGLRLRPDQRAWLDHYAQGENRSLNSALCDLIDRAIAQAPLLIVVSQCHWDGPDGPASYDVTIGEFGEAIYEGPNRAEAMEAARAKIAELGLPRSAIRFRTTVVDENFAVHDSAPAIGEAA